jgi:hypothetical protein
MRRYAINENHYLKRPGKLSVKWLRVNSNVNLYSDYLHINSTKLILKTIYLCPKSL